MSSKSIIPTSFRVKDIAIRVVAFSSIAVNIRLQITVSTQSQSESLTSTIPAYSVNSYLFCAALLGQLALQLWWLTRSPLAQASVVPDVEANSSQEAEVADSEPLLESEPQVEDDSEMSSSSNSNSKSQTQWHISSYMPFFIASNVCNSISAIASLKSHYALAQILVLFAIIAQLYPIFITLNRAQREGHGAQIKMTLLIAKVSLGILVMNLWRIWGSIDTPTSPSTMQQIHAGVVFSLLTQASGPDPTVGLVFIYTLISLAFGQHQNAGWHIFFLLQTGILAALLAIDPVLTAWRDRYEEQCEKDEAVVRTRMPMSMRNANANASGLAAATDVDGSDSEEQAALLGPGLEHENENANANAGSTQDDVSPQHDNEESIPMGPLRPRTETINVLSEEAGQAEEILFTVNSGSGSDSDSDSDSDSVSDSGSSSDSDEEIPDSPKTPVQRSIPPLVVSVSGAVHGPSEVEIKPTLAIDSMAQPLPVQVV